MNTSHFGSVVVGVAGVAIGVVVSTAVMTARSGRGESAQSAASSPPNRSPTSQSARGAEQEEAAAISFRENVRRHFDEPRDPAWARSAETAFGREFAEQSGGEYSVESVDCRTTTCLATVRWPDYGRAHSTFNRLLVGMYEWNCRRDVLIPAPSDPAAMYEGQALFDCTDARSVARGRDKTQ